MNLSHVERYFADFLSIMESDDTIKLYSGSERNGSKESKIPYEIGWPTNLYIIGTVNIDETTYMFSPKVLDRANVIEFRISPNEMETFFKEKKSLDLNNLHIDGKKENGGLGHVYAADFQRIATDKEVRHNIDISVLNNFFVQLQNVGAEFGYRSAHEMELLLTKLSHTSFHIEGGELFTNNEKLDIAIMQKLLPKLHGSRKKLVGPLETLAGFCLTRKDESQPVEKDKNKSIYQQFIAEKCDATKWDINYKISFEKIERMLKNVIDNGFTSYAEA
jgi:hypothetical protein